MRWQACDSVFKRRGEACQLAPMPLRHVSWQACDCVFKRRACVRRQEASICSEASVGTQEASPTDVPGALSHCLFNQEPCDCLFKHRPNTCSALKVAIWRSKDLPPAHTAYLSTCQALYCYLRTYARHAHCLFKDICNCLFQDICNTCPMPI